MEARARAFHLLKPPCIRVNETTLKLRSGQIPPSGLVSSLDQLLVTLQDVTQSPASLDDKLADYVFFPLSSVLRERQQSPVRALELALQCLKLLLLTGWREFANVELAVQLLILLTFLAGPGFSAVDKSNSSHDLQAAAFECKAVLFGSVARSQGSKDALLSTKNVPAIGHSVTIMLEGIKDGGSSIVQLCALNALQSFLDCFPDREMLSSFFPGIVSSLTQVLTPSTKSRRNFKVLEKALIALTSILRLLLSDSEWSESLVGQATTDVVGSTSAVGSPAWLRATASQVKLALSNVLCLRQHDRKEVRNALSSLCWVVLSECQQSLSESAVMMLETVIALIEQDKAQHAYKSLEHLLITNSKMAELLRGNLYDWLIALPRVMLSNDESAKRRNAFHIATSYSLLVKAEVDMSVIDSVILSTMADSLVNVIYQPSQTGSLPTNVELVDQSTSLVTFPNGKFNSQFDLILTSKRQELETITLLHNMVQKIASSTTSLRLARNALENAQVMQDNGRLVNLWLALAMLKERAAQNQAFDFELFVDVQPVPDQESDLCEELYSYALSILTESNESITHDWRLQGLALEILAFEASKLKNAFRVELVDALYPIVHLMASPFQELHNHAITCLNIVATACGYKDAQELLISNVDYLINAIAVKLNTFDLSPEAPQVLLMMLKLCGPTLLAYLEDLVDSVFEALECFHGYPSLVEMLFSVLRGMVEVGSKAPQFTITMGEKPSHRKKVLAPPSILEVCAGLKDQRSRVEKRHEIEVEDNKLPEKRPVSSWPKKNESSKPSDSDSADDDPEPIPEESKPLSKTYLLLQRITSLTQHHLPSSSPGVRTSLLALLTTAIPYLSQHDDSFLPLVHTLWPVLVPRLEDKEAYVVAGVLEVMGAMCEGAGDFVSSRIEGLWPNIQRIDKGLQDILKPQSRTASKRITSTRTSATSRTLMPLESESTSSLFRPVVPLQTLGTADTDALVLSNAPARGAMQPMQQRPSTSSDSRNPGTTHYIPSTTLTVRAALTKFLVQLVNHVRLSDSMFTQISSEMLYDALVHERRHDVVEAIQARNPDMVWLLTERAKWNGRRDAGKEWWTGRLPQAERGPRFVQVVV